MNETALEPVATQRFILVRNEQWNFGAILQRKVIRKTLLTTAHETAIKFEEMALRHSN